MESKNERMNECVRRPRIIIKLHKLELPNPPRKITMIEKKKIEKIEPHWKPIEIKPHKLFG